MRRLVYDGTYLDEEEGCAEEFDEEVTGALQECEGAVYVCKSADVLRTLCDCDADDIRAMLYELDTQGIDYEDTVMTYMLKGVHYSAPRPHMVELQALCTLFEFTHAIVDEFKVFNAKKEA